MLQGISSELRYVLRVLRRSPGFTAVAVVSLAMGIGANVSMFGVVRTLLLRPLPVETPEELRLVTWRRDGDLQVSGIGTTGYVDPGNGLRYRSSFSYPIYRSLVASAPDDVELFAFAFLRGVSVAVGGRPAFLAGGALADGRYFATLGLPMALGRPLTEADDSAGAPLVAVLSHSFWMRAFGGDPAVVGSTVRVNGSPAEIVGVTARGFRGLSLGGFFPQTEITLPLSTQARVYPRMSSGDLFSSADVFWLRLMARVPEEAAARAETALQASLRTHPSPLTADDGYLPALRLLPGAQGAQPVVPETARLLYLLLGVVGVVLLIACVNLAGLMLARGLGRARETAVRRALGGGRVRLVRQTLLESLVLASAGTLVGLVLSYVTRGLLGDILTSSLGSGAFGDLAMDVELDPLLLAWSASLGVAVTVVFGLLPALTLSDVDPVRWLKQRAGGSTAPRLTLGRLLISLQIAVSVPLVVGAALFLRTMHELGAVELGFDPRGVASFQVDPGYTTLDAEEYPDLYVSLLAAVGEIPGVTSVTLMENALMSGIVSNGTVTVDGRRHMLYRNAVGPALLETLGMELLAGRMPGLQDGPDAPRIGVLNRTAVQELFAGGSPVGRMLGSGEDAVQIVGVVNDTPYRSPREPVPPTLYESALQRPGYGGHNVVLRTDQPLARLEPVVREAVHRVDADLPVPEIRSQTELMARASAQERVFAQLLTLFGGFALLLASIGLYGVTSYSVTRRTGEIGVRMAVGARPRTIATLVLAQVLRLAGIGLLVGVPLGLTASSLAGALLFGVAPTDPASLLAAATVMTVVALGAGLLPALRAASLDPKVALGTE